ncbi:MAG: 5-(carboxyamino)imidazole ribonucleotide synthase [Bacteroidetes bacterium]|nr:5-(carboxyamino)imidazole ribonucleotide synthase [Bacteroidota bacterium]
MKSNSYRGSHIKLGILGGGQLGRMLIQKAIDFNIATYVMDPDKDAPCKELCNEFTTGNFKNFEEVMAFGASMDVITVEIEHVNVDALDELERMGKLVFPQSRVLRLIQDKGLQKEFYRINSIPTAEFRLIQRQDELPAYKDFLPVMQKMRRSGYDGKGVKALRDERDFESAFNEPSVLEKLIDFEKEIAVIVSRNSDGVVCHYPVVDLEFNAEANLVEFLYSPATLTLEQEQKAIAIARRVIEKLEMVGILAVEMFVTKSGEILVNEVAPRPHNSGHQTIEGNVTSQYEQHLRAIFNLAPGETTITRPSVMVNLLGEKGYTGDAIYEGFNQAMAMPGVHIHLYGKKITKPFRKMGHVTVTADTLSVATENAKRVKDILRVTSDK